MIDTLMDEMSSYFGTEEWFDTVRNNFPFVESEEDLISFYNAYLVYKYKEDFPQYCERVSPVEKVRLGFDLTEIVKIFPNIRTEDDLTKAFISHLQTHYSVFFYKDYDVDYNMDTFKPLYKEYLIEEGVKL